MPIDVNVKCVKQKSEILNKNDNIFVFEPLNTNQNEDVVYTDNWYIYNAIIGKGYHLYLKEDRDTTYKFVDFAETDLVAPYAKHMLQDERCPSHGTYQVLQDTIVFNERYLNAFEKLLIGFLKESKVSTCIVLFRLQTPSPERYVGRISLKQFIRLLKDKEIYLNTAYIVSEAEYD